MENNMKLLKASGALGLAALAGIASPYAVAADAGWYIGGNVGQSRAKIDDERIIGGLLAGGFTTTSIEDDNRGLGFKVFGGYQFNKYFALESGYFDLGKFSFTATTLPPGTLSGEIKLKGVNFDAVGILPFTDRFSAFGRIGVNYAQAKDRFSGTGAVHVLNPDRSKRAANLKAGVGLEYDFTKSFGMRLEAERYRIDDAVGNKGDIDMASIGLVYRFGVETAQPPAPAPRMAATEQVSDDSAPRSMPVPPPPPPPPPPPRRMPSKVSFSADSLFDFDKSVVKPAGKQALDVFVADLKGASYDVISVTGHTDRIGSHAYNMRLSERRAEAVKDYLQESAGIPAGKITARGVDGADPVTKPGDCSDANPARGGKARQELITCLQPDRRVEVEVTGTR
jgi:OOP family OmpA-OmpF porin